MGLTLEGRSILDKIEADCGKVRPKWAAVRPGAEGGTIPPTIIERLDEDVTAKAKSIALSAKFGPHYESGIKFV
jgi:hypothetical protein